MYRPSPKNFITSSAGSLDETAKAMPGAVTCRHCFISWSVVWIWDLIPGNSGTAIRRISTPTFAWVKISVSKDANAAGSEWSRIAGLV
ncbi:hypothetical protein [Dyadobacter chenwenxiniae]|uniref:hypothetical protein n=1 Tax=Dyadobacter chenwenxiniae TaxID=2906456 RepID=UPI0035B66CE3